MYLWAGYERKEEAAVGELQRRTIQIQMYIFMGIFSTLQPKTRERKDRPVPSASKKEKEEERGLESGREKERRVCDREGGKKAKLKRAFSRDHSPKTAGDVDAHKTTNPRHKHTKNPKENPAHTHSRIGKVLQCNFPAAFVVVVVERPTQTRLLETRQKTKRPAWKTGTAESNNNWHRVQQLNRLSNWKSTWLSKGWVAPFQL